MTAFKFQWNSKDASDLIPLKDSDSSINLFEEKPEQKYWKPSRVRNYRGKKEIIYNCT